MISALSGGFGIYTAASRLDSAVTQMLLSDEVNGLSIMPSATAGNVSSQAELHPRHRGSMRLAYACRAPCVVTEAPKDAEPGSDLPHRFGRSKELENRLKSPGDPNWMGPAVLEITPSRVPRGQSIPDFRAAFGNRGTQAESSTWSKGTTQPPHQPWAFSAGFAGWGSTRQ